MWRYFVYLFGLNHVYYLLYYWTPFFAAKANKNAIIKSVNEHYKHIKWDVFLSQSIHPPKQHWRCLTRVEVFGFWQFDGGSGLFLQLDDGLTSLPDDGTRRIAGNQNLQEVLAFLCSGEQETGSQRELLQFRVILTSNRAG